MLLLDEIECKPKSEFKTAALWERYLEQLSKSEYIRRCLVSDIYNGNIDAMTQRIYPDEIKIIQSWEGAVIK